MNFNIKVSTQHEIMCSHKQSQFSAPYVAKKNQNQQQTFSLSAYMFVFIQANS